jgi:hypothetical protein
MGEKFDPAGVLGRGRGPIAGPPSVGQVMPSVRPIARGAFLISVTSGRTLLAQSVPYTAFHERFTRLYYVNLRGEQCFVPRCNVLAFTDLKGNDLTIHENPNGMITVNHALGSRDWDIAIADRPEGLRITNHQEYMRQNAEYRRMKQQANREAKQSCDG